MKQVFILSQSTPASLHFKLHACKLASRWTPKLYNAIQHQRSLAHVPETLEGRQGQQSINIFIQHDATRVKCGSH